MSERDLDSTRIDDTFESKIQTKAATCPFVHPQTSDIQTPMHPNEGNGNSPGVAMVWQVLLWEQCQ